MDPWPMIEADRSALAEYLSGLSADDWTKQSLCADWIVEEVVAHMLVIPTVPKGRIFLNFLGSGFNLDKFSAKMVARITSEQTTEQLTASIGATASSRSAPPGLKPIGILAEVLVHAGDISEGVGRPLAFPTEHYVAALDYLKDVQPALGCKQRIEGLQLRATDTDWSHGEGPLVEGTAQHLTLAMTGRTDVHDHLSGDGVDTLRGRD
jgi:uncharacterized protein (TIGR03083 family)